MTGDKPAFPKHEPAYDGEGRFTHMESTGGLTKRQWIAATILAGMRGGQQWAGGPSDDAVRAALKDTDELLRQTEKKECHE